MNRVLAVDPGSSSGAIASHWSDGTKTFANMPETFVDIWRFFSDREHPILAAVMEDVGASRPGNSAKSAHTFAEHCGAVRMALLAAGIPLTRVRPQKWMADLFQGNHPKGSTSKEVKARKDWIYMKMQEKYPGTGFTKRQSDSVALLAWGLQYGDLGKHLLQGVML